MFDLVRSITLSGLLVSCASQAAFAQDVADPFSILAPAPEQAEESAQTLAARHEFIGPHTDRETYLAARGERSDRVLETRWQVEQQSLDGTVMSTATRELVLGDGYVLDQDGNRRTLFDFVLNRELALDTTIGNRPLAARAHRQMDVFTRFTRGGELEEVAGPGGVSFERFWIEAATGMRANPVEMESRQTEAGTTEIRRTPEGSAVYTVTPGGPGEAVHHDLLSRWMRHNLPIHPDAVEAAGAFDTLPESFSFIVFSPSSPDGRRETWTLSSAAIAEQGFPWPEDRLAADVEAYGLANPALITIAEAGTRAARHMEAAPTTDQFIAASQSLMQAGDMPGAYLTLMQGTHHDGECQPNTNSELCSAMTRVIIAGLGNQTFQSVANAVASRGTDPEGLLSALAPYTSRSDFAGAAANLMSAEAAARSSATPDEHPLPIEYFAASAQIDPMSPLLYWHAGRYAVSQNDIESAWLFFDLAQAFPAATSATPRRETEALEERLRSISPRYFARQP